MPEPFDREGIFSLTNNAGATEYPQAKELSWIPTSHHIQKVIQNIRELNVTANTIKILEENRNKYP